MKPSVLKKPATLCALSLLVVAGISIAVAQGPPLPSPSAEHLALAKEVGTWDAEIKVWTAPDKAPMLSKGTETNTLFGKMWILTEFESDMNGMPFQGHGQFGYDPIAKKFIGTWIDSMGPYLYAMEGTHDEATQTTTMLSTGRDARTGKVTTTKNITRFVDDDTKVFEIHAPVADQKDQWWKMMEINYKRRK